MRLSEAVLSTRKIRVPVEAFAVLLVFLGVSAKAATGPSWSNQPSWENNPNNNNSNSNNTAGTSRKKVTRDEAIHEARKQT